MAVNRDVSLNIIADIQKYTRELAKIPGATDKSAFRAAVQMEKRLAKGQANAAKTAKKAAADSAKAWGGVGDLIVANLSADAIAGAARALFGYASATLEARQETINLSEATGIAIETFAGIELAAQRSGVPVDEITGAFEDFGEVLFDFDNGGGRAAEALELLEVKTRDTNGELRGTDEVLREVLQKLPNVESDVKRNAFAQQLFGDAGNRVNAVLGDGALDAYIRRAKLFGTVLDADAIASTKAWNNALGDLQSQLSGLASFALESIISTEELEDAVGGFVIFSKVSTEVFKALNAQVADASAAMAAFFAGDLAEARARAGEALTGDDLLDWSDILDIARQAAAAYRETGEAIEGAGKKTKDTSKDVDELAENQDEAATSADRLADAQAKLAGAVATAGEQLAKITADAGRDRLSAEELVQEGLEQTLAKIAKIERGLDELAAKDVDVAAERQAAWIASLSAMVRAERDLDSVRGEAFHAEIERLSNLDDAAKEAAAKRDAAAREMREQQLADFGQAVDLAKQFGDVAFSVLNELARRQEEAARDALEEARDGVRNLRDERQALTAQILEEEDEIERARIEARLNELDAELTTAKSSRKQRKQDARDAFKASKQLSLSEIAFNTAAAILMAYAQFGPPPSPVGIASAVAAGAAGIAQAAIVATEKPPQFHTGTEAAGALGASFTRAGEVLASLDPREAILNPRAADSVGRENIAALNQTGGGGGMAPVFELSFEGRQIDTMVARTLGRGGRSRSAISNLARTRPVGQVPVFGGR